MNNDYQGYNMSFPNGWKITVIAKNGSIKEDIVSIFDSHGIMSSGSDSIGKKEQDGRFLCNGDDLRNLISWIENQK